jgi:hypothetical protein
MARAPVGIVTLCLLSSFGFTSLAGEPRAKEDAGAGAFAAPQEGGVVVPLESIHFMAARIDKTPVIGITAGDLIFCVPRLTFVRTNRGHGTMELRGPHVHMTGTDGQGRKVDQSAHRISTAVRWPGVNRDRQGIREEVTFRAVETKDGAAIQINLGDWVFHAPRVLHLNRRDADEETVELRPFKGMLQLKSMDTRRSHFTISMSALSLYLRSLQTPDNSE